MKKLEVGSELNGRWWMNPVTHSLGQTGENWCIPQGSTTVFRKLAKTAKKKKLTAKKYSKDAQNLSTLF